MIDSTNPRSMADNIRKLWDKFKSISGDLLPPRSTATTGQILKLTGENKTPSWADEYSYTPPAYSETEVNTGQKWIDGKDIYFLAITGVFDEITATTNVIILENFTNNLLYSSVVATNISNVLYSNVFGLMLDTSDKLRIYNVSSVYSGKPYLVTIYYTKPDPAPETRDDDTPEEAPEEVKETKTRKKTTK